jgi:hypothetical protein
MPVASASVGGLSFQQFNYLTGGAGRVSLGAGGINPGATAVDSVLAAFAIPGSLFDGISNRGVRVTAFGTFAANTNVKTVKMIYAPTAAVVGSTIVGGTTLVATPALSAATNSPWFLEAAIIDIVGANNQLGFQLSSWYALAGALTDIATTAPSALAADETKDIIVAITGNAATAVTDISLLYFNVQAFN